jgi:hypothetical protein
VSITRPTPIDTVIDVNTSVNKCFAFASRTKVAYRPVRWRIAEGNLDAGTERLVLIEMLKGEYSSRSLSGPYEYDNIIFPHKLAEVILW